MMWISFNALHPLHENAFPKQLVIGYASVFSCSVHITSYCNYIEKFVPSLLREMALNRKFITKNKKKSIS